MDTLALRSRLGFPRRETAIRALGALLLAAGTITTLAPGAGAEDNVASANLAPGQPAPQVDSDGDGISNHDEVQIYGLNAFDNDTDDDGLGDGDELYNRYGYSYPNLYDSDYDGLSDLEEVACLFGYCTSAIAADTDFDGRSDRDEIYYGGNPLDPTR
jgi:thrombospondin type 3 repeat protein